MTQFNVGIIGAGNISGAYLKGSAIFPILNIKAIADLDLDRAKLQAESYGIEATTPEALLEDNSIDIVVNITPPQVHARVITQALQAGKHVYSEKPLATDFASGQQLLELANAKNLYLGCAPDTFLGGGLQSCRKLIDDGLIGEVVAAQGFFVGSGPESWHPNPDFFYQQGAGPLLDIGPYLITTLVHLMGSVKSVAGLAQVSFLERTVTAKENYGAKIPVEVPTHVTGLLRFAKQGSASITASFDVPANELPHIEIYGSEATLSTPDPNHFAGPVRIRKKGADTWEDIPLSHDYTDNQRGLGVADMAHAIASGRKGRASGELALHVLEVMEKIIDASEQGKELELETSTERPAMFPVGMEKGILD